MLRSPLICLAHVLANLTNTHTQHTQDIGKLLNAYFWLLSTFAVTSALQTQLGKVKSIGEKSIVLDNLPDWVLGELESLRI